jgi:hypothetical protein
MNDMESLNSTSDMAGTDVFVASSAIVTATAFVPNPHRAELLGLVRAFAARAGGIAASLSLPTCARHPAHHRRETA